MYDELVFYNGGFNLSFNECVCLVELDRTYSLTLGLYLIEKFIFLYRIKSCLVTHWIVKHFFCYSKNLYDCDDLQKNLASQSAPYL